MVGCLGGLGRSLAKWMVNQGARDLIFLSRSGTEKETAAQLVHDLEATGARVLVVRGDVRRFEDVEKIVAASRYPIGGVVQASMAIAVRKLASFSHRRWTW